ncbi:MAG: glycosyltransferase [Agathobacter sp.]|nr:glycosyltransferase [Agathobacter sp.]
MISVAMATYNGEKYIYEQLLSIKKQIKPVDEVIICDDLSSDRTVEIINEFIEENNLINWKVFVNEQNVGYIQNFYKAISYTKGDYVFLSDQDDLWCDNKTLEMCEKMQKNNINLLYSAINVLDNEGNIISRNLHNLPRGLKLYDVGKYCKKINYCGMSMAFDSKIRDEVVKIGFLNAPSHDWAIGLISVIKGRFASIDEVYTLRRMHDKNEKLNFQKAKRNSIDERIEVIETYLKCYDYAYSVAIENDFPPETISVLEKYIKCCKDRIKLIKNKSTLIVNMIWNIKYYQSFVAYICDIMYVFDLFRFRRGKHER